MYVHYYYYIIGVLRDATKSKELSRAKFKREGSGEFLRYLSLSFSRSLSLSLSALPWVSINLLNFLKGKRRGNVARCVACARDRHFWIETRETFFIPSSPSFLRPRIYYPVNELRSSSFFWQKIHLYACEERKRAYIYICMCMKKRRPMRECSLPWSDLSSPDLSITPIIACHSKRRTNDVTINRYDSRNI